MFDNIRFVQRNKLGKEFENVIAEMIERKADGCEDVRELMVEIRDVATFDDFIAFCNTVPYYGRALREQYQQHNCEFRDTSLSFFVHSMLAHG